MKATDYLEQEEQRLLNLLGNLLKCSLSAKKKSKKTLHLERPSYECDEKGRLVKIVWLVDDYTVYYDENYTYVKQFSGIHHTIYIDADGYRISEFQNTIKVNNKKVDAQCVSKYDKNRKLIESVAIFDEGKRVCKNGVDERGTYKDTITYDNKGIIIYREKEICIDRSKYVLPEFCDEVKEIYPNGENPLGAYCTAPYLDYDILYYEEDLRVKVTNIGDFRAVTKYNEKGYIVEDWFFNLDSWDIDKFTFSYDNQGNCIKERTFSVDIDTLEETLKLEKTSVYDDKGKILIERSVDYYNNGNSYCITIHQYDENSEEEGYMLYLFEKGMLRKTVIKGNGQTHHYHYSAGTLSSEEILINENELRREPTEGETQIIKKQIYVFNLYLQLEKILPPEEDFIDDNLFRSIEEMDMPITYSFTLPIKPANPLYQLLMLEQFDKEYRE